MMLRRISWTRLSRLVTKPPVFKSMHETTRKLIQKQQSVYKSLDIPFPILIKKKRDGESLTGAEIKTFIKNLVDKKISSAQIGAMLMAIFKEGLDDQETESLTKAMIDSGEVLTWPEEWKGIMVDKHSTGGVGDKVSLILVPALAACGVKIPKISGRGLEHTGGTLDKLESIPGFNVFMTNDEMQKVLTDVGGCIAIQTEKIAPADKILYAKRHETCTVDNDGLITGSIISKKASESLDVLILDVKVGKGAFKKDVNSARELAEKMVRAGKSYGIRTKAMLTKMDEPLGNMIGNALEVAESICCLHGDGPADLTDLTVRIGGEILYTAGKASSLDEACEMVRDTLNDGKAIAKFRAMMIAQGVDKTDADKLCQKGSDVYEILPKAQHTTEMKAMSSGYVHDIDAMGIAIVATKLGGGRGTEGDIINYAVGLELKTSVGKHIKEGEPWIKIHHDDELPDKCLAVLREAIDIQQDSIEAKRVIDIIV